MNFDKFKDIDMPDIKVEPDFEYTAKLNKLPKSRNTGKVFTTLGTVAAAVAIVAAVTLWAIIGRGIRGAQKATVSIIPSSQTEIEITDTLKKEFKSISKQYGFQFLPVFEEQLAPSVLHTARYMYYLDIMLLIDEVDTEDLYGFENSFVSGATINEFAKNTFRCDVNARPELDYCVYTEYDMRDLILQSLVSYDTESGEQYFIAKLTDKKGVTYDIAYVGNSYAEPTYFVSVNRSDLIHYVYAEDKMLYAIIDHYKDVPALGEGKFAVYNTIKLSDELYACSIHTVGAPEDFNVRKYASRYWSEKPLFRYIETIYFDKDGEQFTMSENQNRVPPVLVEKPLENMLAPNTTMFEKYAYKYKLWALPVFEYGSLPDTQELVNYAYAMNPELFEGNQIDGLALSVFLWDHFKLEYNYGQELYTAQPTEYVKPTVTGDYGFRSVFDLYGGIYTYKLGDQTRHIAYYSSGDGETFYNIVSNTADFDFNSIIKEVGIY